MPKMRSKSAAKKRFRRTGTGKMKYRRAFGRHILTSKSSRRKRRIQRIVIASAANTPEIQRMLRGG